MVGLFSRFGGGKGHRRSRPSADGTVPLAIQESNGRTVDVVTPRGFEAMVDFKPLEHPTEPPDDDVPIECPPPEPSIIHDRRIWNERMSRNGRRRSSSDLNMMKDEETKSEDVNENAAERFRSPAKPSVILPTLSAPVRKLGKLLEEADLEEVLAEAG